MFSEDIEWAKGFCHERNGSSAIRVMSSKADSSTLILPESKFINKTLAGLLVQERNIGC